LALVRNLCVVNDLLAMKEVLVKRSMFHPGHRIMDRN
jgi:hypothetical protein